MKAAMEGLDETTREQLKRETLANIERMRADPEAAAAELAGTCSAGKQGFNLHDLIFPRGLCGRRRCKWAGVDLCGGRRGASGACGQGLSR